MLRDIASCGDDDDAWRGRTRRGGELLVRVPLSLFSLFGL
jgi:hypothetical protein